MDARTVIVEDVIEQIRKDVPNEFLYYIQNALFLELNKYNVSPRKTRSNYKDNSEFLLKKFLASKKLEGLSDSTLKCYEREIRHLIDFLQKPIDRATTQDLRYYLNYRKNSSNISNRSLDNMRRWQSSFFSYLFSENYISVNPCLGISSIKYRKTIQKPFTPKELEQLRNACKTERDLALLDFLYSTGCRVSEISNLNIKDVDFMNGECKVLGKGNKERIVYLTEVAQMTLEDYLDSRHDNLDALFIGRGTTRLTKDGIQHALKRIGESAGVEDVYPHRYRRTLATNLLDRGMDIQDVAKILGHADLKTTQIYCYIDQSNIKNAYHKYAN